MKQHIQDLFTDDILQAVMARFAIEPAKIRPLKAFESFIYEFEREDRPFILRVNHTDRRSAALIQAEAEWMNYLADGGAGVARAILSANSNLVESVSDQNGGHFLATAFVKAAGGPPGKERWNETLFEDWGRLVGKMHRLSKAYRPSGPKRPNWDDPEMLYVQEALPQMEHLVLDKYHQLLQHIYTLPKDAESYGLVHQDFHAGNFFVDEVGDITLFDFDDCAYSWYANDIAIVLFYVLTNVLDAPALAGWFWPSFLRGYRQENQLDPAWFAEIPHFLKLREIDLYAVILQQIDLSAVGENSWVGQFMRGRKERIEQDVPYVAFEFKNL